MTALLTGLWQGARQFESNEVQVVTQLNQGTAAARVLSAGDTTNPDELKDDLEKYEPWESWDSSRRNGATPLAPGKNPADLTTMIRTISRVIYTEI